MAIFWHNQGVVVGKTGAFTMWFHHRLISGRSSAVKHLVWATKMWPCDQSKIPSSKLRNITNWKDPPCYQWENSTISTGSFSIAMLNYQRVSFSHVLTNKNQPFLLAKSPEFPDRVGIPATPQVHGRHRSVMVFDGGNRLYPLVMSK